MKRKYTFTVDEEDPMCERCDYINSSDYMCSKLCGPENWWNLYCRTEIIDDSESNYLKNNIEKIDF